VKWAGLPFLWLILPVALAAAVAVWAQRRRQGVRYSQVQPLSAAPRTLAVRLRHLPLGLRLAALALLTLAALRPQALKGEEEVKLKGISLMLVTDLSGSMVADDLKPDRFTAEKKVLGEFITRLPQDEIGLVVFGAKSFTQSPLTLDHDVLANAVQELTLATVDADGTAIGEGILTAVNRLAAAPGESRIIVLATDGTNNRGLEPEKAAEIAAARKIRVYVVGIGAKGGAPVYAPDPFGVKRPYLVNGRPQNWEEPNDAVLRLIASKTGGEYYRATDEKSLAGIYGQIGRLIKDEKKRRDPHYRELSSLLILAALGLLALETLLAATWLRTLT
jgi:Ca-activated chloride channel homolog